MSDKKRLSKAEKELEDTKILIDFLLAHDLSFDDINNFTDQTVTIAKHWWKELNEQFDGKLG